MSRRVPPSKDNVSLPPISQILNMPSGQPQSSTLLSHVPGNGYGAYTPHGLPESQSRRHSYAAHSHGGPQPYTLPNSGSSSYYDPGSASRSSVHSVPGGPYYGSSYTTQAETTPAGNPSYRDSFGNYSSGSYPPGRSDYRGQGPIVATNPHYAIPSQAAPLATYSGQSAYPVSRINNFSSWNGRAEGGDSTSRSREGCADDSTNKTRYECSYCGKGFSRPSALKIHVISHTGDKDFVCPEDTCRRRFGIRSNMLRHIRLVHQNMHTPSEFDGTE
ncbi:uncharacterized protein BT62DRAFT_124127 [Guyanagaster necrorhizus]|uniref:C2H2-type domain-containing protein n=1 Tax=Guyanagaster necrorhizus TaxID=856835 RepID=A0A9P7VU61_9AGAR|nr:uncharacterized protein BT62DRAFT_124127 [Guyanagaster necrorhizus MCA 3950]KAG7446520.1 hypothetical protein BT62DRAFT_124127 [Guyanagaster necrorhizus MCA 3950]